MENRPNIALITGASSGIGEATAWRMAQVPGTELVLVARRENRLRDLAKKLPVPATYVAVDLTEDDAPGRVLAHVQEHHERLDLLVNNAGASWRGTFEDEGYANVHRTMDLNFDSVVRLTETMLPMLRASAPSSVVNVASTAARISRGGAGAYSASKYALAGWTDALHLEEQSNGVHVGLVLPGFVKTEGFPADELTGKIATRWMVTSADKAADAIYEAGPGGKAERYVPKPYGLIAVLKILAPGLTRRILGGAAGDVVVTKTGADAADRAKQNQG
ncbi:MAG: SDR family NAD(P)-dependent oxidoreductase [Solirubrobacterales bacterium]